MKAFLAIACIILCFTACRSPKESDPMVMANILDAQSGIIEKVKNDAAKYRVQILYTQIDRNPDQSPRFTSYSYRFNHEPYFYPASTVKLPAALLALEKLKQLGIDPYTPMLTDSIEPWQSPAIIDSSAESLLPSVAHYARKVFLVSDNDAFNRLYEFLGQAALNDSLHQKGYKNTRIVHRLSIALAEEQNATSNPVRFVQGDSIVYQQGPIKNEKIYWDEQPMRLGKGEISQQKLIEQAKDFGHKNYFPLDEQQKMLRAIFFPKQAGRQGFDLGPEDYAFLYRAMGERPHESAYPQYDDSVYYDAYVKFFMYGDSQERIPEHIRIFNKVGVAYGFLTDNAYIIDLENNIEFMLSVTIWVNENQIFNDDQYEYDQIGFPFLGQLGRTFYDYELKREYERIPELSQYWPL